VAAGANVNANDGSALGYASAVGHMETVQLLLKAGAKVHDVEDNALDLAKLKGQDAIAKILTDWMEGKPLPMTGHNPRWCHDRKRQFSWVKIISSRAVGQISVPVSKVNEANMYEISDCWQGVHCRRAVKIPRAVRVKIPPTGPQAGRWGDPTKYHFLN